MWCKYCEQEQPDDYFQIAAIVRGKVYKRKKCTRCKMDDQNKRLHIIRTAIDDIKKLAECDRCGFDDWRALDFHHREDEFKEFNIGDAKQLGYSLQRILTEIEKCDIICANCHRIEHFGD